MKLILYKVKCEVVGVGYSQTDFRLNVVMVHVNLGSPKTEGVRGIPQPKWYCFWISMSFWT